MSYPYVKAFCGTVTKGFLGDGFLSRLPIEMPRVGVVGIYGICKPNKLDHATTELVD
jgi:hypothetical protein